MIARNDAIPGIAWPSMSDRVEKKKKKKKKEEE